MDTTNSRRWFLTLSLGVVVDSVARALGLYPYNLPASGIAHAAETATTDNLQTAYAREKTAAATLGAYANKADAEGYGKVASLFRASAKSKEVQAGNFADALKKSGGSPKSSGDASPSKSTQDNISAAIVLLTEGRDEVYPAYLKKAKDERNTDAMRAFNYARSGDDATLKFFADAKKDLSKWKGNPRNFYVCPTCSQVVGKVDFVKCLICYTLGDKYVKVS